MGDKDASTALHGKYRQDKRALRGAKTSAAGGRDESWQSEAELAEQDDHSRAITLSSLPRGYWATLFNLEVVKARNRPIEPPKKPEAAPFFLSTVHRDGEVEPSFAKMDEGKGGVSISAAAAVVGGGKGTARVPVIDDAGQAGAMEEDVPDLPSGGGVWSDDDDDGGGGGSGGEGSKEREGAGAVAGGVKRKATEATSAVVAAAVGGEAVSAPDAPPPARRSRILKQIKTSAKMGASGPSRCKLADLLLTCEENFPRQMDDEMDQDGEEEKEKGEEGEGAGGGAVKRRRFEAVMVYLKKLPPPMVDVDISLLCQGDWDEEGVHLVGLALQFLLEELRWVDGWACRRALALQCCFS